MNKKGFIFVVSAAAIVAVLLIVFLEFNEYSYSDAAIADQRRLNFNNDFVKGFNQDFERAVRIASFRSLIALEEYIASSGQFLNDTGTSFSETAYNGTINGVPASIMANSSIKDYLNKVNMIADRFGLEIVVNITEIILTQHDPWFVNVDVVANVSIIDKAGLASWQFTQEYESEVPIANLRDPTYSVFTQGRFYNTVRQYDGNLSIGDIDQNIMELMNDSYYIESSYAPSFIQRFSNNLSPNPAGIESLVNIAVISDQEINVFPNRVKVDYMYFNELTSDKRCDFDDISEGLYFVLPSNRLTLYHVNALNHSVTCP